MMNRRTGSRRGIRAGAPALTETYVGNVLGLGPIAYWPLNETSGTTAYNVTQNAGLDGTITGLTLANLTGPMANEASPYSDGANDYVTLPGALDSFWDGDTWTISLWADITTFTLNARFFHLSTSTSDTLNLWATTTPAVQLVCKAGGNTDIATVDSGDAEWNGISDWTNIIFTRNQGTGSLAIYLDAGGPQEVLTSTDAWTGTLSNIFLFAGSSTPTNVLDGHMGHFVIFDRVVNAAERAILQTVV